MQPDFFLTTNLNIPHNYFNGPTNYFLYVAKFLDTLAKPFFPCRLLWFSDQLRKH